jgi:hypothetical protein
MSFAVVAMKNTTFQDVMPWIIDDVLEECTASIIRVKEYPENGSSIFLKNISSDLLDYGHFTESRNPYTCNLPFPSPFFYL